MKALFLAALVSAGFGLSELANAADDNHNHGSMDHSKMDHSKMGHSAAQMDDAQFLDKFSQHHKDGIKMAEMAVNKVQNPELKNMAQKMVKDQTKEIEQMEKWRKDQYASVPATDASVPKMDMSSLEKAEGAEFDRQFASMMAKHHDDGIAMAKTAAPTIESKQVKKFAQTSAKNQTKQNQQLAKLEKKAAAESGATKAE